MSSEKTDNYSYLDKIRLSDGDEKSKEVFNTMLKKDIVHATNVLNDQRLTFPCLYVLSTQNLRQRTARYLSSRNSITLQIIEKARATQRPIKNFLTSKNKAVHSTLKWIIETGAEEQIPDDDYEEVLDMAASVLINIYKDEEILTHIVDLIFKRNRQDRYIHDLV